MRKEIALRHTLPSRAQHLNDVPAKRTRLFWSVCVPEDRLLSSRFLEHDWRDSISYRTAFSTFVWTPLHEERERERSLVPTAMKLRVRPGTSAGVFVVFLQSFSEFVPKLVEAGLVRPAHVIKINIISGKRSVKTPRQSFGPSSHLRLCLLLNLKRRRLVHTLRVADVSCMRAINLSK